MQCNPITDSLAGKETTLLNVHITNCAMQLEPTGNKNSHKDVDDLCCTSTMPPGWIREVRERKTGKTAGKLDVYIIR